MAIQIWKLWSGIHLVIFGNIFRNILNIQSGCGFLKRDFNDNFDK